MANRAEGETWSGRRNGTRIVRSAAVALVLLAAAGAFASSLFASAGQAARVAVTDEIGRTIEVAQPVRRMVSLAPSLTETIFALGAGDRLVGDTDACDYPAEAKTKTKVGSTIAPSIEEVIALRPDLVLATESLNRQETVDALDRLGVPVYVTDPRTVQDVVDSTARLANVIGAGDAGPALLGGLRARLETLRRRLSGVPARRVLFVVWMDPLISIGRHTFISDALAWAGAMSVVETDQNWPHMSLEMIVKLQPEYLVFAGSHGDAGVPSLADLQTRPGWRDLEAVRAGRVVVVSDALLRPCPRILDAIEELARDFHPEAFSSSALRIPYSEAPREEAMR
ncbi:MAG: ABC transporter substrate-binding protein [Candidatus Acidiferrales bacterium]